MMKTGTGIEALIAWALLFEETDEPMGYFLNEPAADYSGMLEGMEARELLALIEMARQRLTGLDVRKETSTPVHLYIDKNYSIRMGDKDGLGMPLRPMVKALFILFLKHPEGILFKQRGRYQKELEEIYGVVAPGVSKDVIIRRVERLVNLEDNTFSENASVLNAKMSAMFPEAMADSYKIQGNNGLPRRIPLNPLFVHWV